ncbi:MAG: acyl carrier protein [Pseudomonadota bacterium]
MLPESEKDPLKAFIEQTLLGGQSVTDDEDLLMTGRLDSLGVMSLVAFIEEHYAMKIPFGDVVIENFVSLSAMSAYIATKQEQS